MSVTVVSEMLVTNLGIGDKMEAGIYTDVRVIDVAGR